MLDQAAACRSDNSDGHSNQVTLRQARLVQGWVTIFEQAHDLDHLDPATKANSTITLALVQSVIITV